jgi:diadenosine tetraphosphate (Ap4A) HIT family hydrolase
MGSESRVEPQCPLCRTNGLLKSEVLADSPGAYLVENLNWPGDYLIIPSEHIESPLELPDTWWRDMRDLIAKIPHPPEYYYNITLNVGKPAGQTIKHLHFWIIPREAGRPSSGKGLATFIKAADQL